MTIKVKVAIGNEFGDLGGKMVSEEKVFTSIVDFNAFVEMQKEFDAEDEILEVKWEC